MGQRSGIAAHPLDYAVAGTGHWPDCRIEGPPVAHVAAALARNLRAAVGDRSARSVAADAGLNHRVVNDVLAGKAWASMVTIVKLEAATGQPIWPEAEAAQARSAPSR